MTNNTLGDCTCLNKIERNILISSLSSYIGAMTEESKPMNREIYNEIIETTTDIMRKVDSTPLCK